MYKFLSSRNISKLGLITLYSYHTMYGSNVSSFIVNVSAPIVNASAPIVNASAPIVNVSAPIVDASSDIVNASSDIANNSKFEELLDVISTMGSYAQNAVNVMTGVVSDYCKSEYVDCGIRPEKIPDVCKPDAFKGLKDAWNQYTMCSGYVFDRYIDSYTTLNDAQDPDPRGLILPMDDLERVYGAMMTGYRECRPKDVEYREQLAVEEDFEMLENLRPGSYEFDPDHYDNMPIIDFIEGNHKLRDDYQRCRQNLDISNTISFMRKIKPMN